MVEQGQRSGSFPPRATPAGGFAPPPARRLRKCFVNLSSLLAVAKQKALRVNNATEAHRVHIGHAAHRCLYSPRVSRFQVDHAVDWTGSAADVPPGCRGRPMPQACRTPFRTTDRRVPVSMVAHTAHGSSVVTSQNPAVVRVQGARSVCWSCCAGRPPWHRATWVGPLWQQVFLTTMQADDQLTTMLLDHCSPGICSHFLSCLAQVS